MLFGQCLAPDCLFGGPLKQREQRLQGSDTQKAAVRGTLSLVGLSQLLKAVNISFGSKCEKNSALSGCYELN